ncbi:Lsr2 family protein [Micromonospora sp. WMMD710]|uniref:histone-like nucleoid-structuring protein Lsr2 n=1 Tax=Micromonospora sp. WMMD710 TaxID=3016085 RepID=UPI002417E124|nr:Lsr2 family protein [Micromonospora sp. WMMD710]MDG4760337.1 Lsr2 family protein [Micromonospora sp. WMMD710]
MAKQIIHKLLDDLDGGDADETVRFALDGVHYEIDLSSANAGKLREVFGLYTSNGSRVGRGGVVGGGRARGPAGAGDGRVTGGRVSAASSPEQNKAIRVWAKRAGKNISDRGRIPQEIVMEFHAQAGR